MSEDKKEEVQEKSLERRLTRRQERRVHRIETIVPPDRFTKTSDFVQAILTGEIIANKITGTPQTIVTEDRRKLRDIISRPVVERPTIGDRDLKYGQTQITDKTDFSIRNYELLVDSNNRGICHEIALRSPSDAFSLSVEMDGVKQFNRTYTEFATLSPQSTLIDAFVETHGDELYVLHIGELSWKNECKIAIWTTATITFANIFVNIKEFML